MDDEAAYICDFCGEEIVIPVDVTAGGVQEFVEDCPVCCNAILIRCEIDANGEIRISAESEQDRA